MAKKKDIKEKCLTEIQLTKIEVLVQRQQIVQYELKEIDFKMQLIKSGIEQAKLHIKLQENVIKECQRVVPDYKKKIASIKTEERDYMNEVKEDLNIESDKWGFDPDSGIVKEETE